jgi:renalase
MARLNQPTSIENEAYQVVIIGAGLAGMSAASILAKAGVDVLVLERESDVGGRCATVRDNDAVSDVGAQFFTVRNDDFRVMAMHWIETGTAREWARVFPDTSGVSEREGHPRYCGTSGMCDLAKSLGYGLRVRTSTRVKRIAEGKACWLVELEERQRIKADIVVLTPPIPVSLRLISDENTWRMGALLLPLSGVYYKPLIAVSALLDGPSGLPFPGAVRVDDSQLAWIADNQMKGISPNAPAVTLHGTQKFCEAHKDAAPEEIGALLAKAATPFLRGKILNYKTHVWQHGTPESTLMGSYYLVDGRAPLYFSGDAFSGGLIEGAVLSGMAAAQAIAERLKAKLKNI